MASLKSFVVLFSLALSGIIGLSFSKQEVMTIKTKNNIFDCVDFYKQPAFNHPLLKNLTFKEKKLPNLAKLQRQQANNFGLKDGGCPMGTVPILRLNSNRERIYEPAQAVAVVQTKYRDFPSKNFYGVSASLSVWRPMAKPSQWSSARIKLKNAGESIEAGWRVYQEVYNDDDSHLYAELLSKTAECVAPCTAFVQVARGVPLGMIPDHYSQRNGELRLWNLSIDKHQDDGNWWLSITSDKRYLIGYWPMLALTYLRQVSNQVDWGGEIRAGHLDIQEPDMGTGTRAYYDEGMSATIMHMKYVNNDFHSVDPEDTTKVWNWEQDYTVLDAGYKGPDYGRMMYYGGPWDRGWKLGKN